MVCLKTFCFCCDTRKGSIVIGYATGGISVFGCVGSVIRLLLGLPLVMQNDDYQGQFPFNPLFFVFTAVYFAFHSVASLSLVPAVKENREIFLVPSIVMLFVDMVLDCTAIVAMGIILEQQNEFKEFFISGIAVAVIFLPLLVYSSLIVLSQYEEIFRRPDKVPLKTRKPRRASCLKTNNSTESSESSIGTTV